MIASDLIGTKKAYLLYFILLSILIQALDYCILSGYQLLVYYIPYHASIRFNFGRCCDCNPII